MAESGVTQLNAARTRKVQAGRHAEQAAQGPSAARASPAPPAGSPTAPPVGARRPRLGFMERQKYLWNPLMDYWFRMEIGGWERIPEPPVLLIGIHSGAPFVWDAWTVGVQWWRHFGS